MTIYLVSKRIYEWNPDLLNLILSSLKLGKSRDPLGLVSEIFKPDVAGKDLTSSLLSMLNKSKSITQLPGFMQLRNISSIYKGKGEKMNLDSDRVVSSW